MTENPASESAYKTVVTCPQCGQIGTVDEEFLTAAEALNLHKRYVCKQQPPRPWWRFWRSA